MKNIRRELCQSIVAIFGLFTLSVYSHTISEKSQIIYTEKEKYLLEKFNNITGFAFVISGFGKNADEGFFTIIKDKKGNRLPGGYAWERGGGTSFLTMYPLNLESIEIEVYKTYDVGRQKELIYCKKISVTERIPDDLLNDLRRDPKGNIRIKIRVHRDGVLLGWDIQRRPGFDPKKRDQFGEIAYVKAVHSFAGGDFREAEIYNGKPVRKGWYIHPKTGEKIETDF